MRSVPEISTSPVILSGAQAESKDLRISTVRTGMSVRRSFDALRLLRMTYVLQICTALPHRNNSAL